jgi:hypothetical protein
MTITDASNFLDDFADDEDYSVTGLEVAERSVVAPERPTPPVETPQPTAALSQQPQNALEEGATQPPIATIGAVEGVVSGDLSNFLADDDEEFEGEKAAMSPAKRASIEAPAARSRPSEAPVEVAATAAHEQWKQRVAAGEVKGYDHPNRGKNVDSPTKKKRKPGATYHRRRISDLDFKVLVFLNHFQFITTKQVGIIRDLTVPSARRLMLGLAEFGVVGQEKFDFGQQLWYLTGKGQSLINAAMPASDTAQPLHRSGNADLSKIRHTLAVGQVAAQLMAGTDPIRKLLGLDLGVGVDVFRYIIPERFIRSSFVKATQDAGIEGVFKGGKDHTEACRVLWNEVIKDAEAGRISWNSVLKEHPELWTVVAQGLYANSNQAKRFHPADLVISFEPTRKDAQPVSIALEIELSAKTDDELLKIIRSYFHQQEPAVYASVIYITNQKQIAVRVRELAQAYYDERHQQKNLPVAQRKQQTLFRACVLTDFDGNIFSGRSGDL